LRVLEYVESNVSRPIGVSDLASHAALSRHHFCRAFHATVGMPPMRYVLVRRIEASKAMLHDDGVSIASVAYAHGFSSQSHYTTAFKKITGTTPCEYRKNRV
jgi:AraC family transcriptional regulator